MLKRVHLEFPPLPEVRYISFSSLPGYLVINTLSSDSNGELLIVKDDFTSVEIDWIRNQYVLQQCRNSRQAGGSAHA